MVELLPLSNPDDMEFVKKLLIEFVEKTDSLVAKDLLNNWPKSTEKFVKVRY